MRKVIMFNLISVDGYFEGAAKWQLDWHQVDDEFNQFAIRQLDDAGGLIFGRITYQGMADYWQSAAGLKDDPQIARRMNSIPKYVFSRTLDRVEWENSTLVKGDAPSELARIKNEPGKDLLLFGSADLASTFIQHNLIDEYRLIIGPVVLGGGGQLFKENGGILKLKLLKTRQFQNGNMLLYYQPA